MAPKRYFFPPRKQRPFTNVLTDEEAMNTHIGREIEEMLLQHSGKSGVHPLRNAHDAFASRALLTQTAEKTLDIQYYIWKEDMSGTLMLKSVRDAADRGVRVRLLLDDNGITGLDDSLYEMNLHDNIEVRLFNPFSNRWLKWIGFITNFPKLNRRMHNKSFTVDKKASIVGGRNIGDEYFGAGTGLMFADLDVLLIGPVVNDISEDFDTYWNCSLSIPVDQIVKYSENRTQKTLPLTFKEVQNDSSAANYINLIRESNFIYQLFNEELRLEWADVKLVSDNPLKVLNRTKPRQLLTNQIREAIGQPQKKVILVSPYFVPTKAGVDLFRTMAERGVDVRILTNSLDATDVKIVHAGYEKRRKKLLKAGIKLYELKRISTDVEFKEQTGPFGSSGSSLHAKTFSVDRLRVFVGSFNFDPRSIHLNTEMGVVIESENLAREIQELFEDRIPENTYEVTLDEHEKLNWTERTDGKLKVYSKEPKTRLIHRILLWFLSKLPIERLL
ncbi:MAG: phospholipase D family protein [Balneolaceae bacterium]|nr:MAG: phospholipase D family protein [Balneolaceae bacterium]